MNYLLNLIVVFVLLALCNVASQANSTIAHLDYAKYRATAIVENATATAQARTYATAIATHPYPSLFPGHGILGGYNSLLQEENPQGRQTGPCKFTSTGYQISNIQLAEITPCGRMDSYSNFALQIQMTISQGDCGGILFRISGEGDAYSFSVCVDGTYNLSKYLPHQKAPVSMTIPSAYNSAIKAGLNRSNTLAIVAQGSTIILYTNSQQIFQTEDTKSLRGFNILFAQSIRQTTTIVTFREVVVWKL